MFGRVYIEIARRAYQRQLAYRAANYSGLVTNVVFGYVRAEIMLALFVSRDVVAGYDAQDAVSFLWVTQAILMVVQLWGWWEVEQTIRTGDVVTDLSRPVSYLGMWLARDLGRAVFFTLFRCVPILLVGQILHGLVWPASPLAWLLALISLTLAVLITFCYRFTVNLCAFWSGDARGIGNIAMGLVTALSGFIVPIPFLPPGVREVVAALPFAGIAQIPADVFLGRLEGSALVGALAHQAAWAAAMLIGAEILVRTATRRVVTQGG